MALQSFQMYASIRTMVDCAMINQFLNNDNRPNGTPVFVLRPYYYLVSIYQLKEDDFLRWMAKELDWTN